MSRRLRLLRQRVYRIIYPLAVPGSGGGGSAPAEDLPHFTIMFR